jgi:hypothetical protein
MIDLGNFIPKWDTTLTDFFPKRKNFKDITGQRFGMLVTLYPKYINLNRISWICQCDCGNKVALSSSNFSKTNPNSSCGCLKNKNKFKGVGDLSGSKWADIKACALRRNIPFNITIEFALELYLKQDKRCALSGQNISLVKESTDRTASTASLDRIDSKKGYDEDNVQWVHKKVNNMKLDYNQSNFIGMCAIITEHQMKVTNTTTISTLKEKLRISK